jgi:hypothetical protein
MIKSNNIFKGGLIIFILSALLFACKKDISEIGVDIVGENPLEVISVDTFSITAYSEIIDSMRTDELSSHLLGAYVDPVFGTINASIYSQFLLQSGDVDHKFGEGPQLDSIVLYLAYANNEVYGVDPNNPSENHISIFEVGEQLDRGESYYHFQNLKTKNELLAESVFTPSFDSVEYEEIDGNGDTTLTKKIPPLSIQLSEEFGMRFIEADTSVYNDLDLFLEEFAGLYITTLDQHLPASEGSLMNINFLSDDTKIILYYSNNSEDSLKLEFVTNSSTARFGNYNHYEYADASAAFRSQVIDGDTNLGSNIVYLQSLAGVRTIVKFPYINKIDDYYNYAVNEAKLFLWDAEDPLSELSPISSLTITYRVVLEDNDTLYPTIIDANSGETFFNGNYNTENRNYSFRITQHMQRITAGETNDSEIRIEIIGGAVRPNRSLIYGYNPTDAEKRMKLQVLYTQIDSD